MSGGRWTDGRVVGGVLVLLGVFALVEARRLHALRTQMVAGAVVGDDTFPLIVGVALLGLGGAACLTRLPPVRTDFPRGAARARMLWGAAVLVGYWGAVPYLGYTASTALASVALFRAVGGYRWGLAVALATLTTGTLHLLFRVWLRQPLPSGLLGL